MAYNYLEKNSDGSYTRYTDGKEYHVPVGDSRIDRISKEYNDQFDLAFASGSYTDGSMAAGGGGGGGSAQNTYNPYQDYLDEMEAAARREQELMRQNIALGTENLNKQKIGINQGYDNASREAYIAKMQANKSLPERLAAQGITGGASETALLGQQANYENNLAGINSSRQQALSEIDAAINNLQATGNMQLAENAINNSKYALEMQQQMQMQQQAEQAASIEQQKNEFLAFMGQYSGDYSAAIKALENSNDPLKQFKINALLAARQEKINAYGEKYRW